MELCGEPGRGVRPDIAAADVTCATEAIRIRHGRTKRGIFMRVFGQSLQSDQELVRANALTCIVYLSNSLFLSDEKVLSAAASTKKEAAQIEPEHWRSMRNGHAQFASE